MAVYIRGLSGEREVQIDDDTTVGSLRAAGLISEGLVVRFNGAQVDDGHAVSDEDTLVTVAPAAKHG